MTQTLGTNQDNDIFMGADGNLSLLSGRDAVMGACATAAKAQLGEMILSTASGIPNFQAVWTGKPNIAMFETYLRRTLGNVDGVDSVEAITTTVVDGVLSYTATIRTQYGVVTANG